MGLQDATMNESKSTTPDKKKADATEPTRKSKRGLSSDSALNPQAVKSAKA